MERIILEGTFKHDSKEALTSREKKLGQLQKLAQVLNMAVHLSRLNLGELG